MTLEEIETALMSMTISPEAMPMVEWLVIEHKRMKRELASQPAQATPTVANVTSPRVDLEQMGIQLARKTMRKIGML